MSKRVLVVDPPSGWLHGFPKVIPKDVWGGTEKEVTEWYIKEGYPQSLVDNGMLKHTRTWYMESDDVD